MKSQDFVKISRAWELLGFNTKRGVSKSKTPTKFLTRRSSLTPLQGLPGVSWSWDFKPVQLKGCKLLGKY